jgi:hypothetical protein
VNSLLISLTGKKKRNVNNLLEKNMTITHTLKPAGMIPLSSTQNRIWFMEHFDRNITAYNIPLDYRMTGELDIDMLIQSIDFLIDRHESLRTVFPKVNGLPIQKLLPELHAGLEIVHLEDVPSKAFACQCIL